MFGTNKTKLPHKSDRQFPKPFNPAWIFQSTTEAAVTPSVIPSSKTIFLGKSEAISVNNPSNFLRGVQMKARKFTKLHHICSLTFHNFILFFMVLKC